MTTTTLTRPARQPAKAQSSVLFDAPGPRARLRNNLLTLLSALIVLGIAGWLVWQLGEKGQWEGSLWTPFLRGDVWINMILPGLWGTLSAAAVATVLALAFGMIFGLGRLSDRKWISLPAGATVEFFRAIPLLILIFFLFFAPPNIYAALGRQITPLPAFWALVIALMLYNGSVLAEIFRAGIRAVPTGQSEAAYSIGLRKSGVMRLILLPQATTAMMPAIVSQLVVLLKDTALGWVIAYSDLLNAGFVQVRNNFGNLIPTAIVITIIYIAINLALSYLADRLEKRSRRSPKTAAVPITGGIGAPAAPGMSAGGTAR